MKCSCWLGILQMVILSIMLMATEWHMIYSSIVETLSSSYQLKSGERPGDGDKLNAEPILESILQTMNSLKDSVT